MELLLIILLEVIEPYLIALGRATGYGIMDRKLWSEIETQYLLDNYGKVDNKILSAKLGRSLDAIRWYASKLGLTNKVKEWTKEELQFLYNNLSSLSYKEIAKQLNRPYPQVAYRAKIECRTKTLSFKVPAKHAIELRKKIITFISQTLKEKAL